MNLLETTSHRIHDVKLVGLTVEVDDLDYDLHLRLDPRVEDTAEVVLHLYSDRHSLHVTLDDCVHLDVIPNSLLDLAMLRTLIGGGGHKDDVYTHALGKAFALAALPICKLEIRALRKSRQVLFVLTIGRNFRTEATTRYGIVNELLAFDRSARRAA